MTLTFLEKFYLLDYMFLLVAVSLIGLFCGLRYLSQALNVQVTNWLALLVLVIPSVSFMYYSSTTVKSSISSKICSQLDIQAGSCHLHTDDNLLLVKNNKEIEVSIKSQKGKNLRLKTVYLKEDGNFLETYRKNKELLNDLYMEL
tara:strand:+ start:51784 stop:52218 length:435 start_codon:yes stop_codon:yes gene_type:complete